MAGRGAKPGERRGGRAKGTPNKRTAELTAMLEGMDCDPLKFMALVVLAKVKQEIAVG